MSAATEYPPVVTIPARARRTQSTRRSAPWAAVSSLAVLEPVPVEPEAWGPVRVVRPAVGSALPAGVRVLRAPHPSAVRGQVRLTRRGVAVLAMASLAVALGLAALAWLSAPSAAHAVPSAPSVSRVTVQAGDTLWAIAARVAPGSDPRATVARLEQVNHLTGVSLTPGQVLRVG